MTPEHLLKELATQEGGVVPAMLGKLGISPPALIAEMDRALAALPHAQGAPTALSPRLDAVLKSALREAEKLKDDYVSTEHLLLALIDARTPGGDVLRRLGVKRDDVLRVLKEVRGSHRVDDPHAESRYQALEKYGRDLTEIARRG